MTEEKIHDRWTDDQEAALLRAIVHWKPVGIHRHFRMVAIREYMTNQGVVNASDEHTSATGIWAKLDSLYDLKDLDEREDSVIANGADDEDVEYWREFELPAKDFEAMMWERRLAPEGTASPTTSRRESTVAETEDPRASPASTKGPVRGARASARKSGRLSRLQNELETEKSSTRTSKAGSTVDEDHPMENADDDDEINETGDEEDEEDEEQEDEERTRSGKRAARGAARGRGRRGRRRG
jgi:MRG-binding protein